METSVDCIGEASCSSYAEVEITSELGEKEGVLDLSDVSEATNVASSCSGRKLLCHASS